jgi:hypothetical protein
MCVGHRSRRPVGVGAKTGPQRAFWPSSLFAVIRADDLPINQNALDVAAVGGADVAG